MLSLDRLRYLHAVATHGSIQAAADALHVSPSAVSQQLAKLEREVDHVLIEREGRGIRLTDAALLLVSRAADVLERLEVLEGEMDTFRDVVAGSVSIAAFPTAARGVGPGVVRHLFDRYPDLHPEVRELEPPESVSLLMRGDVDVVILQDWFNAPMVLPDGTTRLALFDDVVDVALPATHRLARRRTVRLADIANEQWVTWPTGSICHDWLVHSLRSLGHEPRIAHNAAEHATQLAFVAAGLGWSVIPRLGRDYVPGGVKMMPTEPALHRHVFAAWRTNSARRSNIAAVCEALVAVAKTIR